MNSFDIEPETLKELCIITAEQLKLQKPYVIEKDYYLTQVIGILSTITDENFQLIFQGGTCLAKAHNIVERMSEDCDFRMAYRRDVQKLTKQKQRKALRSFRKNIIAALQASDFIVEAEKVRVRNEGQFMAVPIQYKPLFPGTDTLKPYLALEFFLNTVKLPPVNKSVTTLIQKTLGDKVEHPAYSINAMAVMETASEKWVALTRRIATSTHRSHYRDNNLVRHLYDLYKIDSNNLFTDEFVALAVQVIEEDKQQYKNHNSDYFQNPKAEIERALQELQTNSQWQQYWQAFVETMVFADVKPTYSEVLQNLLAKSELIIPNL